MLPFTLDLSDASQASGSGVSRMLRTTVAFLEMSRPPTRRLATPAWIENNVAPALGLEPDAYRRLLNRVGRPWHWVDALRTPDATLAKRLAEPGRSVHVFCCGGMLLGFFEIAMEFTGERELVYFGLVPEAIGLGYGRALLSYALAHAWSTRPPAVVARTCTLDHPKALRLYLSAGFRLIGFQADTVEPLSDDERHLWADCAGLAERSRP